MEYGGSIKSIIWYQICCQIYLKSSRSLESSWRDEGFGGINRENEVSCPESREEESNSARIAIIKGERFAE